MPPIVLDTSPLTHPLMLVLGHTTFIDASTAPSVDLPAGTHTLVFGSGITGDFTFDVMPDGTVEYDPSFEVAAGGFLLGSGTSTLRVRGYDIELDATALSHGLLFVNVPRPPVFANDRVHTLTLAPTTGYGFQPGSGIVADFAFQLDCRGRLTVPSQYSGFARADERRLTVSGYTVYIDGRDLSHGLLPVDLLGGRSEWLPNATVNALTLIPCAYYRFATGSGVVTTFGFKVTTTGLVDFEAAYNGFLRRLGSDTLVVLGFPVVLDATAAGGGPVGEVNIGVPPSLGRFQLLVLAPATNYQPVSAFGLAGQAFTVELDGSITLAPRDPPTLAVATTPRVAVVARA